MLRHAIPGFGSIMENDELENSIIIVDGPPGSLKSTLAFTALMNHTRETNTKGLYLTLEESKERHILNLRGMNLLVDETSPAKIIDYKYSRKLVKMEGGVEGELNWIVNSIKEYNRIHGEKFSCLVIDSLNALYTIAGTLKNRVEVYFFFEELRKIEATTFIIAETPQQGIGIDGSLMGAELFLCDGLIELGVMEIDNKVERYVQIKKMRGAKHSLDKYSIDIEEGKGVIATEELIV